MSDRVSCPACQSAGRTSTVRECGGISTAMYCPPFHDEQGRRHVHDGNTFTLQFECGCGHRWGRVEPNRCWCGWESVAREMPAGSPPSRSDPIAEGPSPRPPDHPPEPRP